MNSSDVLRILETFSGRISTSEIGRVYSYLRSRFLMRANEPMGAMSPVEAQAEICHLGVSDAELERTEDHRLRRSLKHLPQRGPAADLQMRLRVMASREAVRTQSRSSWGAWLRHCQSQAQLLISNMMRPIALPLAGGTTSAVILFSMVMPTLNVPKNLANDVPTPIYQEATVFSVMNSSLRDKLTEDTVIEVQIDGHGRLVDYSVPQGQMNAEIGQMLLFSTYTPAKMFGQPTGGRLLFRRSRITVRG